MVKKKYGYHMLKEIFDEPEATRRTATFRENEIWKLARSLKDKSFKRIYLTGCGSSYYTGMAGRYAIEEFVKIPSFAVPALEFVHYTSSVVDSRAIVICISQSGETIETLKALGRAKDRGAYVLGLTNDQRSTLAKEADEAILTFAGEEIGPGTKTVVTQMLLIYKFALIMAEANDSYPKDKVGKMLSFLRREPSKIIEQTLRFRKRQLKKLARRYMNLRDLYIVGSGPCFPCALQTCNLIKETSFIHAEAFSVEEFRHGPMEVLDQNSAFIAINPSGTGRTSLLRLMGRVKEIGTSMISFADEEDIDTKKLSDEFISMPKGIDEWQASFLYLPILQLLAYYLAIERKIDPDLFRNIRKTWTTE